MIAKLTTRTIQSLTPQAKTYDVRDPELPGFLLRVRSTGGMVYWCDFRRPDGRRTRIKLGDARILTPTQARDEAHKILGDLARGQDPAAERKAARQETLEEFIKAHYQPWAEAHRKSGAQTVKRLLGRFDEFKSHKLSDISPWKVEKWRSSRLKQGIAAATVNRNVTMLKALLQKAEEWEAIPLNPLTKVRPLKTDQAAKVRFLSAEEEAALRKALNDREDLIRAKRRTANEWRTVRSYELLPDLNRVTFADHLKPMVLLSINLGVRRGELFGLKREDVDLDRRIATIVGGNAKSGKTRHLPLNREAFETLATWISENGIQTGLVFPAEGGGRFDNVNKAWLGVLSAASIEAFRWHDMRHHFASQLVMRGVDLNTVRELLGHSDLKMTLRYAHLAPQVKADAVAKLDSPPRETLILQQDSAFL